MKGWGGCATQFSVPPCSFPQTFVPLLLPQKQNFSQILSNCVNVSLLICSEEQLGHRWAGRRPHANACLCCRLCGSKPEKLVVTSRSNTMTITFKSDASYVDQGFYAEYKAFVPTNRNARFDLRFTPVKFSTLLQQACLSNNVLLSGWAACPGSFQCSNDLCINQTLQCDGWDDCGDHSDEDDCRECTHAFTHTHTRN